MNGIHDMGGMHGFGPVDVADDVAFHEDWERRTRAMYNRIWAAGLIKVDASRRAVENLPPADYLRASYFERWLLTLESGLIERGYPTRDEVDRRMAQLESGSLELDNIPDSALQPERVKPGSRETPKEFVQRFENGDRVRVINAHSQRHTRVPRYVRGKVGVIQKRWGHEVLPDTNAYYEGDQPQAVYNVMFEGREIWGESSDRDLLISLDLWDSYLELA